MLGDLSEVVSSLKTNYELSGYGLYCDNVYLKGSLVLENDEVSAGVSTQLSNQENVVFWAGLKGKKTFYVTKDGYLHAENGFFSGTINASII
jgi:hypothetical protein